MPNGETSQWRIEGVKRNGETYLLSVSGEPGRIGCMGRVLDIGQGVLFPEWPFDSILARGYWYPYTGPQDALDSLLAQVTRCDGWDEVGPALAARSAPDV